MEIPQEAFIAALKMVARRRRVGVDRRQVDVVAPVQVGDQVWVRQVGVGKRSIDEDVGSGAAAEHIRAAAALEVVVALGPVQM